MSPLVWCSGGHFAEPEYCRPDKWGGAWCDVCDPELVDVEPEPELLGYAVGYDDGVADADDYGIIEALRRPIVDVVWGDG